MLTTLLVLCAGPEAIAWSPENRLCVALEKLVAMRPERFTPARGPIDGPPTEDGFQFYQAQFNLPGADSCKVWFDYQDEGWGYDCSWNFVDAASAEWEFNRLTNAVRECYPRAQTRRLWPGRFTLDSPQIKIRLRHTARLPGLVLTIE
jgi:hypothetical protein